MSEFTTDYVTSYDMLEFLKICEECKQREREREQKDKNVLEQEHNYAN